MQTGKQSSTAQSLPPHGAQNTLILCGSRRAWEKGWGGLSEGIQPRLPVRTPGLQETQRIYNQPHTKTQRIAPMHSQLYTQTWSGYSLPTCPLQSTLHFVHSNQEALSESTFLTMSVPRVTPIFVSRGKRPSLGLPGSPHHAPAPALWSGASPPSPADTELIASGLSSNVIPSRTPP